MKNLNARGEIYLTISELFKPPIREFVVELYGGEVKRQMDSWLSSVCPGLVFPPMNIGEIGPDEFLKELKDEYHGLFEGPIGPIAPLIESVYKSWDKDGGSLIGTAQGHLMGYPAVEMMRLYQSRGLRIPDEYSHAPDHLTLSLEYFALETERAPESELREFARLHFDWIEAFAKEAHKTGKAKWYAPIIGFTEDFIKKDAFRADFAHGG